MRGWGIRRSACGPNSEDRVPIKKLEARSTKPEAGEFLLQTRDFRLAFLLTGFRYPRQVRDQPVPVVHELLALAPAVGRSEHVLAEERKGDGRVAVRDHGVGQHAGVHFA